MARRGERRQCARPTLMRKERPQADRGDWSASSEVGRGKAHRRSGQTPIRPYPHTGWALARVCFRRCEHHWSLGWSAPTSPILDLHVGRLTRSGEGLVWPSYRPIRRMARGSTALRLSPSFTWTLPYRRMPLACAAADPTFSPVRRSGFCITSLALPLPCDGSPSLSKIRDFPSLSSLRLRWAVRLPEAVRLSDTQKLSRTH